MQTVSYDGQQPQPEGIVLQDTYRLVRQLGFGGMGVVYEAVHTRLPGRFAIKVLLRSLMSNAEAVSRFCREAEIMSELRHPHIVQVVDFNFTPERQPYFVMEYLEGRTLDAHRADVGSMELPQVVAIVDAIASALATAHQRGIVHRDLKPSNIFLCAIDGREAPFVKVLDFGVSKVRSRGRITLGSRMVGTPHYMSPEQATGRVGDRVGEIDGRADQFALAAIAYEMLTGHDAFVGEDPVALLYQIVHEQPLPLSRYLTWECSGIQAVLIRGLAKDPAQRHATISAFSDALAQAAQGAQAARPPTAGPVRWNPPPDRSPTPAAGARAEAAENAASDEREVTALIDRVPRSPYRTVFLALVAIALASGVVAKGWARTIPDAAVITFQSLLARLQRQPPRPQPEPLPLPVPVPSPREVEISPRLAPPPEPAAARH